MQGKRNKSSQCIKNWNLLRTVKQLTMKHMKSVNKEVQNECNATVM